MLKQGVDDELEQIPLSARIKGTVFLPLIKGLKAMRSRAEPLLDADLRKYFDERILVSEWYPARDHHRLVRVLGELVDGQWGFAGRGLAQFELTGPYRHVVSPGHPLRSLRTLPQLWSLNHSTGQLQVDRTDSGARITIKGWALPFDAHVQIAAAYTCQLLEMCGVEGPEASVAECRTEQPSLVVIDVTFDVPVDDA